MDIPLGYFKLISPWDDFRRTFSKEDGYKKLISLEVHGTTRGLIKSARSRLGIILNFVVDEVLVSPGYCNTPLKIHLGYHYNFPVLSIQDIPPKYHRMWDIGGH